MNHVFGVHGHMIMEEESAARTGSLERFFPGFTEDSREQATLSADQSGIGCKSC